MYPVGERGGVTLGLFGLILMVTGTFLPWSRSGSTLRDSYASIGAVHGLLGADLPWLSTLMLVWLAASPLCALCVVLYAIRLRRISACLVCVISLCVGTASGLLLVKGDSAGLVSVADAGPILTLIGATLALLGAITVLGSSRARRTHTAEGRL